jgi:hypothetical protein
MGYDNFALLSVEERDGYDFDEFCEYMADIGKKYLYAGDPIFGCIHHTSSIFCDSFYIECDKIINEIFKKYKDLTFNIYVSEFDGECLSKITYKYEKDKIKKSLKVVVDGDDSCSVYPNIDSLNVKNNLSEFFCKNYNFCFE